jgi:hypothetical protein
VSQPVPPPVRQVIADADLATIVTAISAASSTREAVGAAITTTFTILLAAHGETLASYGQERPLDPSRFAIPAAQWEAITGACLARADAFGGRACASMDLVNLMPASYPDPAVTVTMPPPADQRPPEYTLTVTRQAADVIAAASARCADLALSYGSRSRQHADALMSWERQLARLFLITLGAAARVTREDDLSLLVTTSSGYAYGLIFHPARRTCTVPGCTATIASDGTARAHGNTCPDGEHQPSYPLDAPEPGTWTFHS